MSRLPVSEKSRIAVGLSGGVDSAVAAYVLKEQGHQVLGLTMRVWDGREPLPDEGRSGCFGPGEARDLDEVAKIASCLDIPHHAIEVAEEYRREVLEYFRAEYRSGRTPNPCTRCNRRVKFGALLEKARQLGVSFDYFATGHYARVDRDPQSGRWLLRCAVDTGKDQTYFLSHLTQDQLAYLAFPLGGMKKSEVRSLARKAGLGWLADKPESQDFLEGGNYEVLFNPEDSKPGPIVDCCGRAVGRHEGLIHYTIGQRRGLGLSGAAQPLYVVGIDGGSNTVVVGGAERLWSDELRAGEVNWIALNGPPEQEIAVAARIRAQHDPAAARLRAAADGSGDVLVAFAQPQRAITPGQTIAVYRDDVLLMGGVIKRP